MSKKLTAREKHARRKEAKKIQLEYDFGGAKADQMMFLATPQIGNAYIREIPRGETRSIVAMRNQLARRCGSDSTYPVSTSFFIRILAEAALEDLAEGKALSEVAPFLRVLSSNDKVSKRLPTEPGWLDEQRALERQQGILAQVDQHSPA